MTISLHAGRQSFEIGAGSFFGSFFSTVYVRLEAANWGARFPAIMNDLYQGRLPARQVPAAREELRVIRTELAQLSPQSMVWDYEDRSKQPPWGDERADPITTLAESFVTSDGRDLFDVIDGAFAAAIAKKLDVEVE